MARHPRFVIPGQPQHVIQRGNNRSVILESMGSDSIGINGVRLDRYTIIRQPIKKKARIMARQPRFVIIIGKNKYQSSLTPLVPPLVLDPIGSRIFFAFVNL